MSSSTDLKTEPSVPVADYWCRTQMKAVKCQYKWEVAGFNTNSLSWYREYMSPNFKPGYNYGWNWKLRAGGRTHDLELYLVLDKFSGDVRAECKLAILNSKGEKFGLRRFFVGDLDSEDSILHTIGKNSGIEHIHSARDRDGKHRWGSDKFVSKDVLLDESYGLLPGGNLTIYCEINLMAKIGECSGRTVRNMPDSCESSADLGDLLRSGQFSDVTISAGERVFKAHRAILAARSPYFASLFNSNMRETKTRCIELVDESSDVVEEMLKFIYTGRPGRLESKEEIDQSFVFDVYKAADKHRLEELRLTCLDILYKSMSVTEFMDLLNVSRIYNVNDAKDKTI